MSGERVPADVYSRVFDMELNVSRVGQWAELLESLGTAPDPVDASAILVVGGALALLGRELRADWEAALAACHGKEASHDPA